MPKKIDPELRSRALRLLEDHGQEYASLTAATAAIAKQIGVGHETVRRRAVQAQVDAGARTGTTTKESAEIRKRTVSDAHVVDAFRDVVWNTDADSRKKMTPEGLYGRVKMRAHLDRTAIPGVSYGAVDRAMKTLRHNGLRRAKGIRTTIRSAGGVRAGDLLKQFPADEPNRVCVTDFTYARTWAGWVYVVFIIDVFSRRIVAWHASTSKAVDLVRILLRMALWQRHREGNPVKAAELIHHSDAASQYTSLKLTDRLKLEDIAASIGSVGDAYDNALIESANGLYKTECIRTPIFHSGPYRTITDVECATAGWVDCGGTSRLRGNNTRRLHSSIGQIPPIWGSLPPAGAYETLHYADLTSEDHPHRRRHRT